MNNSSDNIKKDLSEQPNFKNEIGSKDQDHHTFDLGNQSTLKKIQHFLHGNPTIVPVIILILSVIAFGFIAGGKFFSAFNLSLIVQQVTIVGILAAAQTLIILTAGIDLSVAAMMVLASVFMGKLSVEMGMPTLPAIIVGMIVGVATGAINGLLVTRLRLPPFIVTLGTWNIFFALVIFFTGSQSIRSSDIEINAPLLHFWGERINLGGFVFTYGAFLMIAIFVFLWFLLNKTAWGRHVYAIGDVANYKSLFNNDYIREESWNNAEKQALIFLKNLIENKFSYDEIPWFWTDQFENNFQILGNINSFDSVFQRVYDDNKSIEFYSKKNNIIGAFAQNMGRDIKITREIIKNNISCDFDLLRNPDYNLKNILK